MTDKPTRRDLLKPLQLLGLAFGAAVFAGVVSLVAMGFFQQGGGDQAGRAVVVAGIVAGVAFIATLVIVALLLLAVDPAEMQKPIERPVLYDDPGDAPETSGRGPRGT
jgi:Na+/melibiose symporter-like transporter